MSLLPLAAVAALVAVVDAVALVAAAVVVVALVAVVVVAAMAAAVAAPASSVAVATLAMVVAASSAAAGNCAQREATRGPPPASCAGRLEQVMGGAHSPHVRACVRMCACELPCHLVESPGHVLQTASVFKPPPQLQQRCRVDQARFLKFLDLLQVQQQQPCR